MVITPELKSVLDELTNTFKGTTESLKAQFDALTRRLDEDEARRKRCLPPGASQKSLTDLVLESEEYKAAQRGDFRGGRFRIPLAVSAFPRSLEAKDITDASLGGATSGVLVPQRLPGVVSMPMAALRIRNVMRTVPQTTGNSFDYVYQSTRTNAASPQVEGAPKSESNYDWKTRSGNVRTIAHFVDVSRQGLADVPWLRGKIDTELLNGLAEKEEAEILSGDDSGEHLNGIITQATAFDTAYLNAGAGWTRLDILRYAKLQARLAGKATYPPSAFVLHPTDLAEIELTKDGDGLYIVGDPGTGAEIRYIWNLPVVESESIAAGAFLVGAFNTAATLVDRQQATVEISFEHGTNFTSNMATVLCEERVGLAVEVPTAFISGSFTTSPA